MSDNTPLPNSTLLGGLPTRTASTPKQSQVDPWAQTVVDPQSAQISAHQSELEAAIIQDHSRYVTESILGEGGMGEVLLVHDQSIERQVAMKRLKPLENRTAHLRFIEEAKIIGQLEHPSIVPIHDVGVDEHGSHFFIMKKVEGETLSDIITKLKQGDPKYHQKYSYEVRLQIFLGILNAIDFAHARGFIHRDIKPENMMIGPFGEVMVMDWGLAKQLETQPESQVTPTENIEDKLNANARALDVTPTSAKKGAEFSSRIRLTHQGDLLGTPAYMAPEQALGQHDSVDRQTDIYALGVLLHELMTLEHYLSEKDSMLALLFGVCHDQFSPYEVKPHPSQGFPPAEYMHICKHAMQKEKSRRYASVADLIEAIHIAQSERFPCECPVTLTRRANNEFMHVISNHPIALIAALVLVPLIGMSALVVGIINVI